MKSNKILKRGMERNGTTHPANYVALKPSDMISVMLRSSNFDPSRAITAEHPNIHKFPQARDFIARSDND